MRLDERSSAAPAVAGWHDQLYLAWTGSDRHVNLLTLAVDGPDPVSGEKTRFEEATSHHGPAVCSHQGGLVVAWSGTDHRLNVAHLR